MKLQELRELPDEELRAQVRKLKEAVFRGRFKMSLGQADPLKSYRADKKMLARVKTVLRERELAKG
jgi:large subunit ribosomal protein L29